jgi:hypothetical protein
MFGLISFLCLFLLQQMPRKAAATMVPAAAKTTHAAAIEFAQSNDRCGRLKTSSAMTACCSPFQQSQP